jgi:cell division protein FtsW
VEYRFKRITAFLNPWEDPYGSGYHIIQSFLAFGSGGLTGAGLGQGTQKLFYLPYAYSDFIFSVVGEELGFIGALFVILAYALLAVRGFRAARRAPDLFGAYLAAGITCLITVGAILNTGVVTGLFPTKGMTLPFISYGGSSLVVNMLAAGILINVSGQGVES